MTASLYCCVCPVCHRLSQTSFILLCTSDLHVRICLVYATSYFQEIEKCQRQRKEHGRFI